MSPLDALAILAAGVAAGAINTIVGSGTLITFPVLIALGWAPVTANVSNNIGLVPGALTGSIGYRRELSGQRAGVKSLAPFSAAGAAAGAALLLVLPASAFEAIVPVFIALAIVLVALQPRIDRALAHRRRPGAEHRAGLRAATGATGIYGGYFGAAQGILLMALFGLAIPQDLQRSNALKNVLSMIVNLVAGIVFVFAAHVDWAVVGLIAVGSVVGGYLGARYGRRLSQPRLRALIVVVGLVAIVRLVLG
jgi:uncharacterized membrane protein YfcA